MFQKPLCVAEASTMPVWDAKCRGVLLRGTQRNCLLKRLVASEPAVGDGTLKGGLEAAGRECSSPCVGSRKGVSPGRTDGPGPGPCLRSQGGHTLTHGNLGTYLGGGGIIVLLLH